MTPRATALLGFTAAVACGLFLTACSAPTTNVDTTRGEPVDRPFLAAADDYGALVMDPTTSAMVGYQRGVATPIWQSKAAFDRKYIVCRAQCPAAVASGSFTVVEGPIPDEYAVSASANGSVAKSDIRRSFLWATDPGHSIVLEPTDESVPESWVRFRDAQGGTVRIRAGEHADWYPTHDGRGGLLRPTFGQLFALHRAPRGWTYEALRPSGTVDTACADGAVSVIGSGAELWIGDRALTSIDRDQVGSCDLWGDNLLVGSYYNSNVSGNLTTVELMDLEGRVKWRKEFHDLSRPYLVNGSGEVVIVSQGVLRVLDASGAVEREQAGVTDVRVTSSGALVVLTEDGTVEWR